MASVLKLAVARSIICAVSMFTLLGVAHAQSGKTWYFSWSCINTGCTAVMPSATGREGPYTSQSQCNSARSRMSVPGINVQACVSVGSPSQSGSSTVQGSTSNYNTGYAAGQLAGQLVNLAITRFFQARQNRRDQANQQKLARLQTLIDQMVQALNAGSPALARQYCLDALKLYPRDENLLSFMGSTYAQEEDWENAVIYFRRAVASNPNNDIFRIYYGVALVWEGKNLRAAETQLRRALALHSKARDQYPGTLAGLYDELSAVAHFHMGHALYKQGKNDEAEAYYQNAYDASPNNFLATHAQRILGEIYEERGETDRAIAQYISVLRQQPENDHINARVGVLYKDQNNLVEAEKYLRRALTLEPKSLHYTQLLADVVIGQGNIAEGEKLLRQRVQLDSGNDLAHWKMGSFLERQGRLDDAGTFYRQAIQADPKDAGNYSSLGNLLHRQGNYAEAEAQYREAIRLDPTDPFYSRMLSETLRQQGKLNEAEQFLKQAQKLDKTSLSTRWLGYFYDDTGRLEDAEKTYRQALAKDSKDYRNFTALANNLQKQGNLQEAEDVLLMALSIEQNGTTLSDAAVFYARQNDFQTAEKYARQGLETIQDNSLLHHNLGYSLAGQGRYEEAKQAYQNALKITPENARTHFRYAETLEEMGQVEEAYAEYKKATMLDPEEAEYQAGLTALVLQHGRGALGAGSFQLVLPPANVPEFQQKESMTGEVNRPAETALEQAHQADEHGQSAVDMTNLEKTKCEASQVFDTASKQDCNPIPVDIR